MEVRALLGVIAVGARQGDLGIASGHGAACPIYTEIKGASSR